MERREVRGTPGRFEEMLPEAEDSATLSTSFAEWLNRTIGRGSAYLMRGDLAQARRKERLAVPVELLRCLHDLVRPHRALKSGHETRTPATQAALAKRRLSFRGVFLSGALPAPSGAAVVRVDRGPCPCRTIAGRGRGNPALEPG